MSNTCVSTVQEAKAVYDQVGSVPKQDISFASVIQPLLDVERDSATRGVALQLPAMVATDKNIRDASNESEKQLDEFSVEMSMRKDVFDNIVAFRYCILLYFSSRLFKSRPCEGINEKARPKGLNGLS